MFPEDGIKMWATALVVAVAILGATFSSNPEGISEKARL